MLDDPPRGLIVIHRIDALLDRLDEDCNPDSPKDGKFRRFALHRYAERKPISEFPDGSRLDAVLMHEIRESSMDAVEMQTAIAEARVENMRRAHARKMEWQTNSRKAA